MCETHSHNAQFALTISIVLASLTAQNSFAINAGANAKNIPTSSRLCETKNKATTKHITPRTFTEENNENTEISADTTQSSADGSITLDGNVVIERNLLRIKADHANYNKQQEVIDLKGNIHIDTESMALDATTGTVNVSTVDDQRNSRGKFNNTRFYISESKMNGQAEDLQLSEQADSNKISILRNTSITSCNLQAPDWLISAETITLDHNDESGTARNVIIRFKAVPFLYTPYMQFPTSDKRRSGLLFPEFGTSTSRGLELATPWYWNIAPNQDAIITPHFMEKRGLELGGNYRFLTQSSNGQLTGAYLPGDQLTDDDRYQVRYQQRTRFQPNLLLDVDLQDISDTDYFNDFSNNLGSTSQTHLFRNATLRYNLNNWHMRALVQDIKTIDTSTPISDRPYERLPQLTISGNTKILDSAFLFTLDSEFVDFTHDDANKTTGNRFTIRPGISLPLSGAAWFIKPAIKFNHTQYDVGTDSGVINPDLGVDDRSLAMSSIDAGLYFERYLANGYQQTLEPRLYYLNVPFENQDNTPIFDTSTPEFSVSQLFRDNRFIGGDRIGDANQLTLALTSRIINTHTGREFLRASIGQIFYFKDRRVTLDGTVDTSKQSDVIAELDSNWGHWQSNIDLQWDTKNNELSKENYFLHYRSDAKHLFNLGYRKRLLNSSIDIEQTDTSFVYAMNQKYSLIARWSYSLKDQTSIDTIAGVAYDSCCWSIQLLTQRRLKNTTVINTTDNDAYDNAILVQFVFKGLGSLSGNKARNTLKQSIFGYTDIFQ